ncbi:hypothetical protein BpHYR1_021361 [Brachionus plicatilis]|uniref:Uncharacterized protein n=1 Tax=Brachionus plicatilis TaxID=10195 RepID=A0A3M7Q831_BRAPC|nr:hypothetical protein BpHYR1_021361 [Brachionus plicatilis]
MLQKILGLIYLLGKQINSLIVDENVSLPEIDSRFSNEIRFRLINFLTDLIFSLIPHYYLIFIQN